MLQRQADAKIIEFRAHDRLHAEVEVVNRLSIQADIDEAFASVRLATGAIRADRITEAAGFIKNAIFTHKSVAQKLGSLSSSRFQAERLELQQDAERLLEGIRGVERQFQVLLDADPHQNTRRN